MRHLSDTFMACLQSGFLAGIPQAVREDPDLNLEIRQDYLNIYFKGNSLLKLSEAPADRYKVDIHQKFAADLGVPPALTDAATTAAFLAQIPHLKQAIIRYGKSSVETEYEQMIIRANNFEPRTNSEYFVIDRQYVVPTGRFDLTAIFWDRSQRRQHQTVDLCLMEVKYGLNPDIGDVDQQLTRYYEAMRPVAAEIAGECETILRQKLALGLYAQAANRLAAMQTLTIARDFSRFQFIIFLIDYNPNSARLDLAKIQALPFHNQVRVYQGGLAMWQQNVRPVGCVEA